MTFKPPFVVLWIGLAGLTALLPACGQRGPLYAPQAPAALPAPTANPGAEPASKARPPEQPSRKMP
ncbi:MAG: lipoprotein [Limnobacter sp.]|nr:lipoprotein [Limnobacter sp.]